jgi:hypothetical protein
MSPTTDSLAQLSTELAKLLEPLSADTVPPNTVVFFAELGITLTDAQAAALGAPLNTVAVKTDELLTLVPAILSALSSDQYQTVFENALQAATKVREILAALDAVATSASALAIPHASDIATRAFNLLLARYLESAHGLNDFLEFVGLLTRQDFDVDSVDPLHPPYTLYTYDFGAISEWLESPSQKALSLFGWGAGFDGHLLFPRLEQLLALTGAPVIYDSVELPQRLDVVLLELTPTPSGPAGLLLKLKTDAIAQSQTIPLGTDANLEITSEFQPPIGTQITILTDGTITFTPPSPASMSGAIGAKLVVKRESPPDPFVIFGQAGGSRVEVMEVDVEAAAKVDDAGGFASGALDVSGTMSGGKVVIDTTKGDGFLNAILPSTRVEADFSVIMGVSTERGFYFSGSSALEVRLPVHIPLGPLSIEALTLDAAIAGALIPLSVGADIRAMLGPVEAVVQNMGVSATLSFPSHNGGNLGPVQLDIGFKPPNGVGLRVNGGPLTGGGFLSFDAIKGEYVGALELSFQGIFSLKAVGIIDTKMPDGSSGFSLLILVTTEFTPLQLGFGFTLLGVGGLLALNHTLDTEALRLGVRSGSIESVLFPPDVIGNIARIVSDLKSFFPLARGHFIYAPMCKLGWATPTLISIELGIILDIPSPQLTIIGVLRCILPEEDAPILRLQVNFAGGIDLQRGLIWFDASLFDSNLAVYTLTGDMALRISWGEKKILLISVGGFHPAFHDVPSDLTEMRRITIALLSGDNPRLTAQTYFAVTPNTYQSGARVELYAAACGFNIYGFLGYDLLVQRIPLHFDALISAGLALRHGDDVIAGIDVSCELSGPLPFHAHGDASFSVLFFSISISFDHVWGEDALDLLEDLIDVLPLVVAAVEDARSWVATIPANTSQTVSLRQVVPADGSVLLHPFGVLTVSQKVAPLELPINRFGERKPAGDTTFTITHTGDNANPAQEEFAIANFVALKDSEKLSRKSFEPMKSGLQLDAAAGAATGVAIDKDVTYEMSYLHEKRASRAGRVGILKSLFDTFSRGGAAARTPLSVATRRPGGNGPSAVAVSTAEYYVVNTTDLTLASSGAVAASQAEAYALRDALVRSDPTRAGALQVLAAHELIVEDAA